MAKLIYASITSLDGFVADENGTFGWAEPDEEVHSFINDLQREVGTYLYGRRMYEVMSAWESMGLGEEPSHIKDFGRVWRSADKVVFSKTLGPASTSRTRIEREFDPPDIRRMKASAGNDLAVGGAGLAAQALREGLVDECHLFLAPVAVGGGTRSLPAAFRLNLELLDERRFRSGFVYLRYRVGT